MGGFCFHIVVDIVEKRHVKKPFRGDTHAAIRRFLTRASPCPSDYFRFLRAACLCCVQGKVAKVPFLRLLCLLC